MLQQNIITLHLSWNASPHLLWRSNWDSTTKLAVVTRCGASDSCSNIIAQHWSMPDWLENLRHMTGRLAKIYTMEHAPNRNIANCIKGASRKLLKASTFCQTNCAQKAKLNSINWVHHRMCHMVISRNPTLNVQKRERFIQLHELMPCEETHRSQYRLEPPTNFHYDDLHTFVQ